MSFFSSVMKFQDKNGSSIENFSSLVELLIIFLIDHRISLRIPFISGTIS